MASRRYIFVTLDMVEQHFTRKAAEFFRGYPDLLPDYQYLDGARGRGELESALAEPRQTFGGQYMHRTIYDKAAALWRSVTLNHPFIDAEERPPRSKRLPPDPRIFNGKVVCITGDFKPEFPKRDHLVDMLENEYGAIFSKTITKKVQILIMGENLGISGSSKQAKGEKLGILVLTKRELMLLLDVDPD